MAVVNYQTLNIGVLLHLLPCDLLRSNVTLIEKLNKRFINDKYGNIFNEAYIYIYKYIDSRIQLVGRRVYVYIFRSLRGSYARPVLLKDF